MKFSAAIGAGMALGVAMLGASSANAAVTVYTMSDFTLSGTFGTVTASGTFTEGPKLSQWTSNVTVVETQPVAPPGSGVNNYTYNLTGRLDGPGWGPLPSQLPPICFFTCVNPTPATFHLDTINVGPKNTSASLLDSVDLYTGFGTVTSRVIPGIPEPATWAMMLVGVAGLGGALRVRRRPVAVRA